MHTGNSSSNGAITNMQLAPLIDIALVLVIIFMVTAPILEQQSGVDLPRAAAVENSTQARHTITISRTGEIALNEVTLPQPRLERELRQALAQHPERMVLLRADKHATHKQTLEVLNLVKRAGAKKMAIATLQQAPQTNARY